MKLNSPLPQPLPKECAKAVKIFHSFVDGGNNGLDGVIPRPVLQNAKGFAIFTVFKAGFLFSARAGSGVVIARLEDGSWSAPSAIGTAGLGVGGQAGAEVTDFLIVLNSRAAVKSFMSAGSLSLGGNMSIAVGPLGRNGEASGSLNTSGKLAAMFSYSKTKGLFGGVSLEGTAIVERQDANAIAYNSDVTVKRLLSGAVDIPSWAQPLIKAIESCTGLPGNHKWIDDRGSMDTSRSGYAFGSGMTSPGTSSPPLQLKKSKKPAFPPATWGEPKENGSYFDEYGTRGASNQSPFADPDARLSTSGFETQFQSDFSPAPPQSSVLPSSNHVSSPPAENIMDSDMVWTSPASQAHTKSASMSNPRSASRASPFDTRSALSRSMSQSSSHTKPYITPKPELATPLIPGEGVARAIALYNFEAVESGDLAFSKGDIITIIQQSDSTDDWWTGRLGDRKGIFPANFVEVVK